MTSSVGRARGHEHNGFVPTGPVVVCDPGVDDLLALLVLAGSGHPPSAVIGTAGNVPLELAYANARGIVDLLGLDCPVARGTGHALRGPYPEVGDPFHGDDGLGGAGSALRGAGAVEADVDPLSLVGGAVLATGPLTVIAAALEARRPVSDVVWMGGAVDGRGNMTACAEFNAWLDPEAADQVLSGATPIAMVPLDVTHQVPLTTSDLRRVGEYGRLAAIAAQACAFLCERDARFFPHDAVAAVAWLNPELFEWEQRQVRCEGDGRWTRGMTVVDRRSHAPTGSVRVAVGVDADAVRRAIFEALRTLGEGRAD